MASEAPWEHPSTNPDAVVVPSIVGNAKRLAGKVIVVSGGTQGCGEGIAIACAEEGAEAVVICGRQEAKGAAVSAQIEARGAKALYVKADLTEPEQCKNVVAQAEEAFGRVNGLVNCAAVATRGDWFDASVELIDRLYALNFRAPFLMTQGAAKVMAKTKTGGSVVNIGSINGHGGQSNLPVYSCTKGALMTMTKHAAWALRREKIRVNYLAVGWMYTPAEDALMQSEGSAATWIDDADKNHPYGRLLRPADIAKQVVHLLSDDAVMQSGGIIDFHENYGLCCWDGQPKSA
jgi:NAD(P)-dependent dehydrogenase (short-subunit alcohol dehydrogenase family)